MSVTRMTCPLAVALLGALAGCGGQPAPAPPPEPPSPAPAEPSVDPTPAEPPAEPAPAAKETLAGEVVLVDEHLALQIVEGPALLASAGDPETVARWFAGAIQTMSDWRAESMGVDRILVVQLELRPDELRAGFAGVPPLPVEAAQALYDRLGAVPALKPSLALTIRLYVATGSRTREEALALHRALPDAEQSAMKAFAESTPPGRYARLRQWAGAEALLALGHVMAAVDEAFVGVRAVGQRIVDGAGQPVHPAALAGTDPSYWRAVLELAPEDPSAWAVRALALAADGALHQAFLVAVLGRSLHPEGAPATLLLDRLLVRLRRVEADAAAIIAQGVARHDADDFAAAIALYDMVLAVDPEHPMALYERGLSARAAETAPGSRPPDIDWASTRARIDRHNPLFPHDLHINRGVEIFRFVRRREFHETLMQPVETAEGARAHVKALADAALELDVDVLAGLLYHQLVLVAPDDAQRRAALMRLALAAWRLGAELPFELQPDYATAMAAVEAEVRAAIAAHEIGDVKFSADEP